MICNESSVLPELIQSSFTVFHDCVSKLIIDSFKLVMTHQINFKYIVILMSAVPLCCCQYRNLLESKLLLTFHTVNHYSCQRFFRKNYTYFLFLTHLYFTTKLDGFKLCSTICRLRIIYLRF